MRLLRALAQVWAWLGVVLLTLLAANFVLLALLPRPKNEALGDRRREADAYRGMAWAGAFFDEDERAHRVRWEPYVYWRRPEFDGETVHVDARGLRRTLNADLPASAPQVFVFGGSTIWGTGARDDHTIPSELSRALREAGTPARVVNYGETGWVSTQELIALLGELKSGRVPSLVVFYDGVNDLGSALQARVAGLTVNEENRRTELNLLKRPGALLAWFAVSELPGVDRLRRFVATRNAPAPPDPQALARAVVATLAANQRLVHALGVEYGFAARFYWQPSVYTKSSRTPFEEAASTADPERRALFEAAPAMVAASPALAANPRFRDLSQIFEGVAEPLYLDFCHLAEAGNARVADEIARDVAPDLRSRPPPAP